MTAPARRPVRALRLTDGSYLIRQPCCRPAVCRPAAGIRCCLSAICDCPWPPNLSTRRRPGVRRPGVIASIGAGVLALVAGLVWAVVTLVTAVVAWVTAHALVILTVGGLAALLARPVGRCITTVTVEHRH
jgi:hypothetical protein